MTSYKQVDGSDLRAFLFYPDEVFGQRESYLRLFNKKSEKERILKIKSISKMWLFIMSSYWYRCDKVSVLSVFFSRKTQSKASDISNDADK